MEYAKLQLSFVLRDGNTINITEEDMEEIADKMILKMITHSKNKIFFTKDTTIEKMKFIKEFLKDNETNMSDGTRDEYYKHLLSLSNETGNEVHEPFNTKPPI